MKLDAMHLFNEKYGDVVRVVKFGDVSQEFCAGAHVKSTAKIGVFSISYEESIASGIRRIEGKTSLKAYQQLKSKDDILNDLDILLKCGNPNELNNKITALNNEMSLLKKQITTLQDKLSSYQGKELAESFINIDDKYILITRLDNFDKKSLTSTFDYLHENYIILLADVFENKISYIAGVSSSLNKEIPAGQLIKKIASLTNGSGGGRNDVAQGGGKDISSLNNALELIKGELIK